MRSPQAEICVQILCGSSQGVRQLITASSYVGALSCKLRGAFEILHEKLQTTNL